MVEKGPKNDFANSRLAKKDAKSCGEYLVPAASYAVLSNDEKGARRLALGRKAVKASAYTEALGRAAVTYGIETGRPPVIILGTIGAVASGMLQTSIKNRLGARWSLLLNEKIATLGGHKNAIAQALTNKKISSEDVDLLPGLGTAVYNGFFKDPDLERKKNVVLPLLNGLALGMGGNELSAGALITAGVLTIPTGNRIFKEHLKSIAKKAIGLSAHHSLYLKDSYKKHVRMTDIMNFATYLPDLILAGVVLGNVEDYGSTAYATGTGLKGYINILYAQKDRVEIKKVKDVADYFIKELSGEPFIVTEQSWKRHTEHCGVEVFQGKPTPFDAGLVIKNFIARKPSGKETQLAPLNLEVEKGGAVVLQANSGGGKSITLMAIMHRYEHRGSVHVVKNRASKDVHSYSGPEEIDEEILLITKDQLSKNDRIVDLFKSYFKVASAELYETHLKKYPSEKDRMSIEVAWMGADNLLEEQITNLVDGEKSIFPSIMLEDLQEIRDKRNEWVNEHIENSSDDYNVGNLVGIEAENRTFRTLSAGQTQSMMILRAKVGAMVKERTAIFFDEPLAGLDKEEKKRQIAALRSIQEESNAAVIIVAHDDIEELQAGLNDCQLINLNK